MRTCIKARMRSNFGQIPPPTTELAARERQKNQCLHFLTHLRRRLKGELIVYPCSGVLRRRRPPFSNMNISEASRPIAIKILSEASLGEAAWGFGADQFRTLASMATDSAHRFIMGKTASSRFLECFYQILFILAGNDDTREPINQKVLYLYAYNYIPKKICYSAIQLENRSYPAHFQHCTIRFQEMVLNYTAIRT